MSVNEEPGREPGDAEDVLDTEDAADIEEPPVSPHRSPRRSMCAAVLALEAVSLGLTTPVMIAVHDVAVGWALASGLGLAVACLVIAGMLRAEWGYALGWAVQVGAIALGFMVPIMFLIGPIFAGLWAGADLLGRKIERERAAAYASYDPGQ